MQYGLYPLWILIVLPIFLVWSIVWKGFALWHSSRNKQVVWFVILLLVNTLGILEIIYLLVGRRDKNKKPVVEKKVSKSKKVKKK
ncbi:hypothetical protein HOI26_01620 [Candidatus Woesearchaeota archaeon]|jgi:hypothetical protein|nr:hypothetical protein [Candidatus Woesearchaeota archaeon]MBT5739774.1 hypothetical protein [Candidatus Woesearchaeota archaeon]